MDDQVVRRDAIALLAESACWLLLVALFLAAYTGALSGPASALVPHAWVSLLLVAGCLGLRALAHALLPAASATWISALLVSALMLASLFYYALVLIGLLSWGRVVTAELLTSYWDQLPHLLEVLNVSPAGVWVACALLTICLIAGLVRLLRLHDGSRWLAQKFVSPLPRILLAVVVIWVLFMANDRIRYAPVKSGEPLAMTFSEARLLVTAVERRRGGPEADRLEEEARKQLKPAPDARRRNVVLIIVDALRPGNLSLLGYARETTPFLNRMAAEGRLTQVPGMRASCAESYCGLTSLFASRYVHEVPNKAIYLHQVLKLNGYRTRLILGGDHANFYGLATEYGEADQFIDGSLARGYYMNDDQYVIDHTRQLPAWDGNPVFFQYHLMSAHQLGRRHPANIRWSPVANYARQISGSPDPAFTNYYDNGVLQADRVIEEILAALEKSGYLKDAVILVTADHGEGLGEQGVFSHGKHVIEPLVRVPLLSLAYGKADAIRFEPNQAAPAQIDIAPTILHELGIAPPVTWRGQPLQSAVQRDMQWLEQPPYFGLVDFREEGRVMKYILREDTGVEVVFDLKQDPEERNNLAGKVSFQTRKAWRNLLPLQKSP